jgi:hypothetical protein
MLADVKRAVAASAGVLIGTAAIGAAGLATFAVLRPHVTQPRIGGAGSVTGLALPCTGAASSPPIRVYAVQNGRTVASQEVPSVNGVIGRYLFRLPSSTYVISAPGSNIPPKVITVRAGDTVTVNFLDYCP